MGREELSIFRNSLGCFSFLVCVFCVCVDRVHVCIFLASSVFIVCVLCVCHWYTSSMFMYFWPLVLLYVCFVCITGTQGPCLCIFGLFVFIKCVLCVCQSVFVYFWPL